MPLHTNDSFRKQNLTFYEPKVGKVGKGDLGNTIIIRVTLNDSTAEWPLTNLTNFNFEYNRQAKQLNSIKVND